MNSFGIQQQLSIMNRRNFLGLTAASGVSFLLPTLSQAAAESRGTERAKSLICLWMSGGPSQLETWDPHPGTKIGGPTTAIPTSLSGLEISSKLPLMAEHMHELNVLRSLVSKEGDHERGTYFVKTGYRPDPTVTHPALGAIISHEFPTDGLDIPSLVSLGGGQWPARGGYLGDEYDAFRVFEPGNGLHNMLPRVADKRHEERLLGLGVVGKSFKRNRMLQTDRSQYQQSVDRALTMMSSDQLKAFELKDESDSTKDRYGDSRFGRGCLVARRLVESGVRAVEVVLEGFDSHANNFETQNARAETLDLAFSALMADLVERDLLESTIVLCIGEFGRTPKINPLDGRDHWPNGFSAVVGGGGLTSGTVIGETDPEGEATEPVDPLRVQDLYATILHQFAIDASYELMTPIGRPLQLAEGTPIERLLRT